ncbi:unnamed protein product [Colias eurytheme]|nr:unnamed protein product [Colias eurytheme]
MGQIVDKKSSTKMSKTGSGIRKSSGGVKGNNKKNEIDFCDPKVQGVLLVGLLAVLALALWFGFTSGCLGNRRRRRRRSCCCMGINDTAYKAVVTPL